MHSVSNHVLASCDWTIQHWSRGTGGISFIDNNKTAHCFAGNDSFIRKPMITNMLKTVPGHEFDPKNLTNKQWIPNHKYLLNEHIFTKVNGQNLKYTSLSDIYLEQLKTNNEKKKSWTFPHNCSHVEPQANNAALYKIHVASIINQD